MGTDLNQYRMPHHGVQIELPGYLTNPAGIVSVQNERRIWFPHEIQMATAAYLGTASGGTCHRYNCAATTAHYSHVHPVAGCKRLTVAVVCGMPASTWTANMIWKLYVGPRSHLNEQVLESEVCGGTINLSDSWAAAANCDMKSTSDVWSINDPGLFWRLYFYGNTNGIVVTAWVIGD